MKELWRKYYTEIITILAMIIVGTCMHFVCDIFDSAGAKRVLAALFPVGESLMEHMKMLWYPFLGAGVILTVAKKDAGYLGGFVIGGIVAMMAMTALFVFYQSLSGKSILPLDITLYVIVIVLSALLAFLLSRETWCRRGTPLWITIAIAVTATIIYLAYRPGAGYLFQEGK